MQDLDQDLLYRNFITDLRDIIGLLKKCKPLVREPDMGLL